MSSPLPIPSPAPVLVPGHKIDAFLDNVGSHVGSFLTHPHMGTMNVASTHVHLAPVLVVPVLSCAVVPGVVWAYKRRRHLRLCLRGLVSVKVWRERWRWHCRISQVEINGHPAPKSMGGGPTRSGVTLLLKLFDGMNLELLGKNIPALAAHLACMDISFDVIHANKGQALVSICRRDSLGETFEWPWMDRETTDFFGPIPAGVDTNGKPVDVDLREKNILVGGGMGSGKSWWLHTVVAAAMLDKRVDVHLLDGKEGSGFWGWRHSASSFATNDPDQAGKAMGILKKLEARINKAYQRFTDSDQRTIDWSSAKHIDLLVIDEFLAFFKIPGFATLAMNLLARGRAAGLIMVMTVQRPSSKIVDTDFRELFPYRAAFLSDHQGSKMILGEGQEADSSTFSGMNPGEMWLLHEGRRPVRCRGYSLTDSQLATLAARAQRLRAKSDRPIETDKPETDAKRQESGVDSPVKPRSPNSVTGLALVPAVAVSEGPVMPVAPQRALPQALRPTLTFIALHGPQVSYSTLQGGLGIASSTATNRCQRLEALGFISGARKANGNGGRDPILWTITDVGTAALTDRSRKETVS